VSRLCVEANIFLNKDILTAINKALTYEESEQARFALEMIAKNAEIGRSERLPVCQDTGMAVVFVDMGQDARVIGGFLGDAINDGVRLGYQNGYLRKSVVSDPISRENTNDNTPAIIHYDIVPGDTLRITVAPKGFGSENMSAIKMLKPSDGREGVINFVYETVMAAGSNPCPPVIVGVGVGGTFEKAALLSKRALLLPVRAVNDNPFWANAERELLLKINANGVGAAGLGGLTTALAVHINTFATHIAGLPVAVNIGCHVTRHAETIL
jgi:fumarate hydratase subunit alpha